MLSPADDCWGCDTGINVRLIESVGGTLLLDEADFSDSQIGADVAKVLNCGYQKNLSVTRMDKNEDGVWVPTLHDVFGPKILNGRKPFTDDATESRCLTYRPTTTGRKDLPVQLPPEFERDACRIRNQALAWRLAVLDQLKPRSERIDGLSPRTNQIILPLLSVTNYMSQQLQERYVTDLFRFAQQRDRQATEDRRGSVEAKLIDAFVSGDWEQPPTCQELATKVTFAEKDDPKIANWLTPKKVSYIVKDLGFTTQHTNRGSVVSIEQKRLPRLCARYGVISKTGNGDVE